MASNKTLNRLADYQIISDLLGTFLDYSQSEREMVMKYSQTSDTKRRIVKEGDHNYWADTGERVLDTDITKDVGRKHAKDVNGQLRYLDGDKSLVFPEVEKAEDPVSGDGTQVVTHDGNYTLINKKSGDVISTGSVGGGAATADYKADAKGYLDNLQSTYSLPDEVLQSLYKRIEEDPEVTEDELTQYKSIADDQQSTSTTATATGVADEVKTKERHKNKALDTYAKFINAGIYDKFGAGPSGEVIRIGSGNVEFTVAKGESGAWSPNRATGVLNRIRKHEESTQTGLGVISFEEGADLVQDEWLAKHTDFKKNHSDTEPNGGYVPSPDGKGIKIKPKKSGTGVSTPTDAVFTAIQDDANGERWGKIDDDLYYFHKSYGRWYKVTGDKFKGMWSGDKPETKNLYDYVNNEMTKYHYLDR
tara:strand:- start:2302 stop:3558 length:1257 start_codon:yes stop_codon:yes gene_type:complete